MLRALLAGEVVDFVEPGEQTLRLGIGRMQRSRITPDLMTFANHELPARWQQISMSKRLFQGFGDKAVGEHVVEHCLNAGIGAVGKRRQRLEFSRSGSRWGCNVIARKKRDLRRRRIRGQRREHGDPSELERVNTFSERCLERRLPAGFDPKARVQSCEALRPCRSSQGWILDWLSRRCCSWRSADRRASIRASDASASRSAC